uniref:Capsid protein n=1 Tax=Fujian spotted paddle-tail newt astrovirus TaxID=2116131 RepID=A0A2P1GMX8_9VIRU|nr:capsid protein [Fujian spotted paddle-tail newt astrovirus]
MEKLTVTERKGRSKKRSTVSFNTKTGKKTGTNGRSLSRGRSKSRDRSRSRSLSRPRGAGGATILKKEVQLERKVATLKKKVDGPKSQQQRVARVVLGHIQPNTSGPPVLQRDLWTFLNPVLLKDTTSGPTYTPLSVVAEQYAMWRPLSMKVTLKSMVGASAVSGTLTVVTMAQTMGAATPTNLSSLEMRAHKNVENGSHATWKVPVRELQGPRQGWWLVDTNNQPTASVGPLFEVFTYGQTMSTYMDKPYPGPLFLVMLDITYQFTNYTPKPGVGDLSTTITPNEGSTLSSATDGTLLYTPGQAMLQVMNMQLVTTTQGRIYRRHLASNQQDILWAVGDAAVSTVAAAFPPWSWILGAGWMILRLFVGNSNTDATQYAVYPSIQAAQQNEPCRVAPSIASTPVPPSTVQLQQLNNPNVGATEASATMSLEPILPILASTPGSDQYPLQEETGRRNAIWCCAAEMDGTNLTGPWDLDGKRQGQSGIVLGKLTSRAPVISYAVLLSLTNNGGLTPQDHTLITQSTATVPAAIQKTWKSGSVQFANYLFDPCSYTNIEYQSPTGPVHAKLAYLTGSGTVYDNQLAVLAATTDALGLLTGVADPWKDPLQPYGPWTFVLNAVPPEESDYETLQTPLAISSDSDSDTDTLAQCLLRMSLQSRTKIREKVERMLQDNDALEWVTE